ncbi:MAG TPA: hypothetical protein VHM67_13560 [Gemmatimonadaceae bacterium]|nr:hypothetical protein [Gemmatimonadaceae bacterium]
MRRLVSIALALLLGASSVGAQIISVPNRGLQRERTVSLTGGIGLLSLQGLFDGSTQTGWDFSQALEYTAAAEFRVSRGAWVGVTASYANMPLNHQQVVSPGGNSYSIIYTDAHVNVYTAGAQFSMGPGSPGFHQVIVINAGIIAFENFHADRDGRRLTPERDIDPRIGIGYGFGYGFRNSLEVFLVQEAGVALHQGEGLSGNDRRQYQQQATRIGVRLGL